MIIRKFFHIYTIQENAKYYISRYILYMLLNSFNYFHYAKLIFFPTNHSFDTHSFLESFRSFVHTCYSPEIVVQRRYRWFYQAHAACRMSRVACHVSHVARPIDITSSIAPHAIPIVADRASKHLQLRNYALNTGKYYPFDFL